MTERGRKKFPFSSLSSCPDRSDSSKEREEDSEKTTIRIKSEDRDRDRDRDRRKAMKDGGWGMGLIKVVFDQVIVCKTLDDSQSVSGFVDGRPETSIGVGKDKLSVLHRDRQRVKHPKPRSHHFVHQPPVRELRDLLVHVLRSPQTLRQALKRSR